MKKISMPRKWFTLGVTITLILFASLGILWVRYQVEPNTIYPTQAWQSATPEAQGFRSTKLAEGLATIKENGTLLHSLTIVRHGFIIVDATFYPYDSSLYHDTASVTKSVMTTLIGIAIDKGKLYLDQPIVSFFPNRRIDNLDTRKKHLAVRHLLNMSSGLDCTAAEGERTQAEMVASSDWVQFVLDRKVIYEPGTHFEYCSPGMHLLSAILQQATGMTALEYAKENLFHPLGIEDMYWPADPQGYTHGWGDLALRPRDMAKLGYLFLRQGRWEDRQIVSAQWIRQATARQIETDNKEAYGFGWWVSPSDADLNYYLASGRGGQRIQVIPSMDLVLLTTGGGYQFREIEEYLQAAFGDPKKPLPADPRGVAKLKKVVADLALPPAAQTVPPLPKTASAISGKRFTMELNSLGLQSVQLHFDSSTQAILWLGITGEPGPRRVAIGLDGLYRASQNGQPVLARGQWMDSSTFVIDYNEGFGLTASTLRMHFNRNHLRIEVSQPAEELSLSLEGDSDE